MSSRTVIKEQHAGVALLCDANGVVRSILCDDTQGFASSELGVPLSALVDEGSFEKAKRFLSQVDSNGAAFDWELNVLSGGNVRPFHFAGSKTADGILVVGSSSRSGLSQIYERIAKEQGIVVRPMLVSMGGAADDAVYCELSRLNNELVNAQRELAKSLAYTTRLQAELSQSHDLLESMYATAPLGLCVIDKDFRCVRINQNLASMHGPPVEDHIGRRMSELLPELWPTLQPVYLRVLQGDVVNIELHGARPSRPDEKPLWQCSYHPVRSSQGDITGISCIVEDVTERRQAEENLRRSEMRTRIALKAARSGVWEWEFDSGKVTWSPEEEAVYGLAPGTFSGRIEHWRQMVIPEDLPNVERVLQRTIDNHSDYAVEFRVNRPDGAIRWIESFGQILYDDHGRAQRIVGVNTDVTQRKQAEDRLRASEERMRLALDASRAGTWTWYAQENRSDWDSMFQAQYGFTADEPASFDAWIKRVHPKDQARLRSRLAAMLAAAHDNDWNEEFRTIHPHKGERWMHGIGRAERDLVGKIYRIVGINFDVTERKVREQMLTERARLLNLSNDAIAVRDQKDRIVYWNQGAEQVYGYTRGEALGRVIHELLNTEFPEPLVDIREKLQRDHRWSGEVVHTRSDGARVMVLSRWALDRGTHGELAHVLETNTDITALKRVEDALRRSHAELEQKVAERTNELRLSLAAVQSEVSAREQTEMRLRELSASLLRLQDEERRRIARDLHDSTGQTLTALKMSLVSLQSAVQQNAPTEELFEDLDALADQAVKEIRTTSHLLHPPLLDEAGFDSAARWYLEGFSKRSQVKVEFHLGSVCRLPEPVEMVLFRVLQESLTNVLRHSGATRAEVRFDVADEAVLSVRDYGEGIPSDRLEQFRLTGGGVGVGLSGMRERARELGGRLDVRSDDCGTIVTVTIPISTDGQKPAPDSGRNAPAA